MLKPLIEATPTSKRKRLIEHRWQNGGKIMRGKFKLNCMLSCQQLMIEREPNHAVFLPTPMQIRTLSVPLQVRDHYHPEVTANAY